MSESQTYSGVGSSVWAVTPDEIREKTSKYLLLASRLSDDIKDTDVILIDDEEVQLIAGPFDSKEEALDFWRDRD